MDHLLPELRKVMSDLDLTQESRGLLLETLIGKGKAVVPNDALRLIGLLQNLRSGGLMKLVPLQKTQLLENLVNLIRQGKKEQGRRICYILYEGNLPPQGTLSLLPEGMIRDLLRWVNTERTDKVREILWAILLGKDSGLAAVAKTADVATGLCEKDPITRNNVIQFLWDRFSPDEVVDSLFQYSMTSGKKIPGVVFKRYAGLLKGQEDQQQKKYILEKILGTARRGDKEIDQIFSDYMNSLNRFDLIRLLSASADGSSRIAELMECRKPGS